MGNDLTIEKANEIRQFWHDKFSPFNPGRDFVVLFGKDGTRSSIALLQLDNGNAIETGGIQPVDMQGNKISLLINKRSEYSDV